MLKLEPQWARPPMDAELARLDREAKWWHRRARDETRPEALRAEAWSTIEDCRRRYDDLRRRLLPVLELAEARRVERMEAGARAEGIAVKAYEARLVREERDRVRAANRAVNELWKAYSAGLITHGEYEKRQLDAWSGPRAEPSPADEAAAVAAGLSIRDWRRRAAREQRGRDLARGGEVTDPGWDQAWLIGTVATAAISGSVGLILAAVFVVTGRSPVSALVGTLIGSVVGWLSCSAVFFGSRGLLERPGRGPRIAKPVIDRVQSLSLLAIFATPSVLGVIVAIWLS